MAEIALAWEMGGESGHLARLAALGSAFRARGHETTYILQDLTRAEALLRSDERWFQAPVWSRRITGLPPAVTAAETLIRFGYLEADGLTGICRAWRNLFDLIEPDLLVGDCAPTALLAARGMGLDAAVCDNGYGVPPDGSPLPPYRWWQRPQPTPLPGAEQEVLQTVNAVATRLGAPVFGTLSELFRGEATFLCTLAELDHYPDRGPAEYFGPVTQLSAGEPPLWPEGAGPRVFVYAQPDYPGLASICDALKAARARTIAYLPGVEQALRKRLKSNRFRVSEHPLNLALVRSQCDAVVCHGGLGTTSTALLAGKPALLLPRHTEQAMVSMRVRALGAGIAAEPAQVEAESAALVRRLLTDPGLAAAARRFAESHSDVSAEVAADRIAASCESRFGLR